MTDTLTALRAELDRHAAEDDPFGMLLADVRAASSVEQARRYAKAFREIFGERGYGRGAVRCSSASRPSDGTSAVAEHGELSSPAASPLTLPAHTNHGERHEKDR
jgi:hypothetical protein